MDTGVDASIATSNKTLPIHIAARNKENGPLFVDALLKVDSGFVNIATISGETPLWYAVDENNIEVVKLLLERGAGAETKTRSQPIHKACYHDYNSSAEILQLLVNAGADVKSIEARALLKRFIHIILYAN